MGSSPRQKKECRNHEAETPQARQFNGLQEQGFHHYNQFQPGKGKGNILPKETLFRFNDLPKEFQIELHSRLSDQKRNSRKQVITLVAILWRKAESTNIRHLPKTSLGQQKRRKKNSLTLSTSNSIYPQNRPLLHLWSSICVQNPIFGPNPRTQRCGTTPLLHLPGVSIRSNETNSPPERRPAEAKRRATATNLQIPAWKFIEWSRALGGGSAPHLLTSPQLIKTPFLDTPVVPR